jgi:hypothetical protein
MREWLARVGIVSGIVMVVGGVVMLVGSVVMQTRFVPTASAPHSVVLQNTQRCVARVTSAALAPETESGGEQLAALAKSVLGTDSLLWWAIDLLMKMWYAGDPHDRSLACHESPTAQVIALQVPTTRDE